MIGGFGEVIASGGGGGGGGIGRAAIGGGGGGMGMLSGLQQNVLRRLSELGILNSNASDETCPTCGQTKGM